MSLKEKVFEFETKVRKSKLFRIFDRDTINDILPPKKEEPMSYWDINNPNGFVKDAKRDDSGNIIYDKKTGKPALKMPEIVMSFDTNKSELKMYENTGKADFLNRKKNEKATMLGWKNHGIKVTDPSKWRNNKLSPEEKQRRKEERDRKRDEAREEGKIESKFYKDVYNNLPQEEKDRREEANRIKGEYNQLYVEFMDSGDEEGKQKLIRDYKSILEQIVKEEKLAKKKGYFPTYRKGKK